MTSNRLREYLDFAIQTTYEAGRLTLGYFQTGLTPDMKRHDTPVTAADRNAGRDAEGVAHDVVVRELVVPAQVEGVLELQAVGRGEEWRVLGASRDPRFVRLARSGVAVILSFVFGKFIYKELQWRDIPGILAESAILSGAVVFIVATNNILLYAVTLEQLADKLGAPFFAITQNKILILLMLNALLLFLGAIVDCLPLMILFIPVIKPLFATLGVDPVHAGVMIVMNMTIGLSTPPVGTSLFIAASIAKTDLQSATRHMTPFLIAVIMVWLLVTYYPPITLWFPDLVMK